MAGRALRGSDAEQLDLEDLVAVERHEPVDRAHPAMDSLRPAHRLRKGHPRHGLRERCRENLAQAQARDPSREGHVRSLFRLDPLEERGVDSLLLRETRRRGCRGPVRGKGRPGRRTEHALLALRLPGRDALDPDRETARSSPGPRRAVGERRLIQDADDPLAQVRRRGADHPRRDLFTPDLDEERSRHGLAPATRRGKPAAWRCAR